MGVRNNTLNAVPIASVGTANGGVRAVKVGQIQLSAPFLLIQEGNIVLVGSNFQTVS